MTQVAWVTGRRKALARCVAQALAAERGGWHRLGEAEQNALQRRADALVGDWIGCQVLATFMHPYREPLEPDPDPITGEPT